MTAKEFLRAVTSGGVDILHLLVRILEEAKAPYCVIGGLAVNAYAEPVVSLDLDLVVVAADIPRVAEAAKAKGMTAERFEHSLNLSLAGSDLRIQLQTDSRYQSFLDRAQTRTVLGYAMPVASLPDVLQGKMWAWSDPARRKSKRQKDLADILRLTETHPELRGQLTSDVLEAVERA